MKFVDFGQLFLRYDGPLVAAAPYPGGDGRAFGTGTGWIDNRIIRGALRWTNIPTVRSDGVVLSEFNGIIEPDEDGVVLFRLHGYAIPSAGEGPGLRINRDTLLRLVFVSQADEYAELNNVVAMVEGVVLNREERLIGFRAYQCLFELPDPSAFLPEAVDQAVRTFR